jgi:hypothetical protein
LATSAIAVKEENSMSKLTPYERYQAFIQKSAKGEDATKEFYSIFGELTAEQEQAIEQYISDRVSVGISDIGRLGGSAKSEVKAAAVRENGKKGGRPKKEPGKVSKIRYGKAEVLEQCTTGIRLIKFNGRFYTTYGRMFAVAGNHVNTPYNEVCEMKRYDFCDWNELRDMYSSE